MKTRPKIYKQNGKWICEHKHIQASGSTVVEAFFNYLLKRATAHLPEDELKF